jgi:outer membrane receptor for monomeric catechols
MPAFELAPTFAFGNGSASRLFLALYFFGHHLQPLG